MKDVLILHKHYYEAIKVLNNEQKGLMFEALCQYAFEGKEPTNADPVIIMGFSFFKAQIDSDLLKVKQKGIQNAENGKKGGRPRKSQAISEELKSNDEEIYFNRSRAAEFLSANVEYLNNWVETGVLTPVKMGFKIMYKKSELEAILQEEKSWPKFNNK
jgi:hypothetical protein